MDPAHGPFVHQAWWWRSRHSIRDKAKQFEPIPNGFRMSPHAPSANSAPYKILKLITGEPATTTIDFVLPNQRFEQIRAGRYWLSSRTTVTPIRRDFCRLDFVAAWNILPWFPIVSFILHVLGPRFIRQDTEVIKKQSLGLKYEDRMMLVDDADRQARWYFVFKGSAPGIAAHRRADAPSRCRPRHPPLALLIYRVRGERLCRCCGRLQAGTFAFVQESLWVVGLPAVEPVGAKRLSSAPPAQASPLSRFRGVSILP